MMVERNTEVVVLENVPEQPIDVIFQDEVQLDINVPLFYIKSGEEEIQAYVDKQAKPQIDDYAAAVFADFREEIDAEGKKASDKVAEYVTETAYPAVQSYVTDVACPAVQSYVAQEIEPELVGLVDAAAASVTEAGNYAALAQQSAQAAATQADAAAGSEVGASSYAAEAAVSAIEAADKLLQVQEIAASMEAENLVHKSGDETLDGNKIFLLAPQIPTVDVSSNETFPATTAWIGQKFQVVSSLPEEPDEHVFYFVTE